MLVQIPSLADPITRVIFRIHGPHGTPMHTVDVMKGAAEVNFDLPEGIDEGIVEVQVVGVGNNGRPSGEPETIVWNSGHADDPGPDGDPGPPGSDDESVKTEEEPADAGKSEIKLADEVTSTIERTESPEFVMPDSAPLSSSLHLDSTKEIISPFNGSEVVKHDGPFPNGPFPNGPQKLGL